MTSISPRAFCETLYCAFAPLDALDVDPGTDGIAFTATETSGGRATEYRVEFHGVRALTRKDLSDLAPREPGDRLELSAIELEREAEGWRVWLNPWYIEEIEFRCDRITLDGGEVIGSGRWLQDDLPRAAG